jgi:hypothetical protein
MLCHVRGLTSLSVLSVAILSLGVAGVSNLSTSRVDNTGVSTVRTARMRQAADRFPTSRPFRAQTSNFCRSP